jgi:8-oxo-dGTP diphosphatase
MPEKIGVVVIVIDKEKKLLLGKRKNAYKAGMYGLPGGRMELKESLYDSAKRELKEETNLNSNKLTYIGVIRELQEISTFIHFAFVCTDYHGGPENAEPEKCEGWEWFSPDEIPADILPGHLAAIEIFKDQETPLREII